MVKVVGEPARELELVEFAVELVADLRGLREGLLITQLATQLERCLGVADGRVGALDGGHVTFGLGQAGHRVLGGRRVVPETGRRALPLEFRDEPAFLLDMQVIFDAGKPLLQPVDPILRNVCHTSPRTKRKNGVSVWPLWDPRLRAPLRPL